MDKKQYHRIRHYPGRWSGLDLVEECGKPGFCMGCAYDHAFCTEAGRVLEPEKYQVELDAERQRYKISQRHFNCHDVKADAHSGNK